MRARGSILVFVLVGCSSSGNESSPTPAAGGEAGAAAAGAGGESGGNTSHEAGAPGQGGAPGEGGMSAEGGADQGLAGAGGQGLDLECPSCRLVASAFDWDRFDAFVTDGISIFARNGGSPGSVHAVDIDGSNRRSFSIPDCPNAQREPQVYEGYVYFRPRPAAGGPSWLSRWQIPDLGAASASCEIVLGDPANAVEGIVEHFIDATNDTILCTFHDTTVEGSLVSLDLSTLKSTVVLELTDFEVDAADATSYFGIDNPAAGSGSYRILRMDRVSKEIVILETYVVLPNIFHVDDQFLYYMSGGGLYRLPKDGNEPVDATPIPGAEGAWQMGVDGDDAVYFKIGEPSIYRAPLAGGEVTRIPSGPLGIRGLIWDDQNYYFMVDRAVGIYDLWALEK